MADLLSTYPVTLWLVLLATGLLIGLLAGLLGVGGGIVAVPVLLELFASIGLDETMGVLLAIGTAQVSILIASLTATLAHWRAGTIDHVLVRAWLPALMVGTLVGLVAESFAPPRFLTTIFAVVAAGLALKMVMGDRLIIALQQPPGAARHIVPALSAAWPPPSASVPARSARRLSRSFLFPSSAPSVPAPCSIWRSPCRLRRPSCRSAGTRPAGRPMPSVKSRFFA